VCREDVEAVDDIDERDGLILLPLLHCLCALDQNDEVIFSSLVVDLGLVGIAFSHDDGWERLCV
jgi:hypothetical protein